MTGAVRATSVRKCVAQFLHDASVAVYKTTAYKASDRAVFLKQMQSAPDTAVAVEVYGQVDELDLPNVEVRVQLLFRGPGDAADEFADNVFDVLHGVHMVTAGGLKIQRARRLNAAPLGPDDNGREQRVDNYALIFQR